MRGYAMLLAGLLLVAAHALRPAAPRMGIRAVSTYDASFTLATETRDTLEAYLRHPDMIEEVCRSAKCEGAEFLGELFQPVPYSRDTPRGMPAQYERYHLKADYAIVHVPPVIMFKAKVFKPSRLCAVYRIDGLSEEGRAELDRRIVASAGIPEAVASEDDGDEADDVWKGVGRRMQEAIRTPLPGAAAQDGQDDDDDDDFDWDAAIV